MCPSSKSTNAANILCAAARFASRFVRPAPRVVNSPTSHSIVNTRSFGAPVVSPSLYTGVPSFSRTQLSHKQMDKDTHRVFTAPTGLSISPSSTSLDENAGISDVLDTMKPALCTRTHT